VAALDAVVFDLYGTLLHIRRRAIHREVPRILGAPHDEWIALVRRLLLEPYADAPSFARAIRGRLKPEAPAEREAACLAAVEREVASVEVLPGVQPLLLFLKRRGFKLGVVSNLVSPHKAPLAASPIGELFDATAFSCDEGIGKPDPRLYRRILDRLGVEASRTLFVGDSLPNDVEAPAAIGMRTVGIGVAGRDATSARPQSSDSWTSRSCRSGACSRRGRSSRWAGGSTASTRSRPSPTTSSDATTSSGRWRRRSATAGRRRSS
jgi:putative hydrolase of the HAD superfamily